MFAVKQDIGERVVVRHNGREARGWLEQVDDDVVAVRLPSIDDPEAPGDGIATFPCPPPPKTTMHITCTLLYDHRGITIGYLDPTWSRTEESARKHAALTSRLFGGSTDEQTERRVRVLLRVRQISLAVPLREASVWNDHGRMWMHEKATLEIEAEDALKE